MPSRTNASAGQQITLRRWRVTEVEARNGTRSRHVWGHDVENDIGLASSQIKEFNLGAMTATTRSGTKYRLVGLPGNSRLGKCAWDKWCNNNKVVSELDVTNEYLDIEQLSTGKFVKADGPEVE